MDGQWCLPAKRRTGRHRNGSFVFVNHITGVADAVAVRIQLVGVGHRRAVVGIVQNVACRLLAVLNGFVRITEAILVKVGVVGIDGLISVCNVGTVVLSIGNTITVTIHSFRKGLYENTVDRSSASVVGHGKRHHV